MGFVALTEVWQVIAHPTRDGMIRVVLSHDGRSEVLLTPDEAREMARAVLRATRWADKLLSGRLDGLPEPGRAEITD